LSKQMGFQHYSKMYSINWLEKLSNFYMTGATTWKTLLNELSTCPQQKCITCFTDESLSLRCYSLAKFLNAMKCKLLLTELTSTYM